MNSEGFFTINDMDAYSAAKDEIEAYLKATLYRFCCGNNIAVMYSSRLKKEKSIINKLFRKKKKDSSDTKNGISDIAGVRIVFCDKEDACILGELDQEIHTWDKNTFKKKMLLSSQKDYNCDIKVIYDFVNFLLADGSYEVTSIKDYISNPKKSGYQSIHLIVKASNGCEVEIQLRNYIQHLFDEFEHDVRYKADENTKSEFEEVCSECADFLSYTTKNYYYANNYCGSDLLVFDIEHIKTLEIDN